MSDKNKTKENITKETTHDHGNCDHDHSNDHKHDHSTDHKHSHKHDHDHKVEDKTNAESQKIIEELGRLILKMEDLMPVKNAGYGKTRVDYIRGKDFEKAVEEKKDFLVENIKKICKIDIDAKSENLVQLVFGIFHYNNMLFKVLKYPDDKLKYPKRLRPFEVPQADDCCGDDHGDDGNGHSHGGHSQKMLQMFKIFDKNGIYGVHIAETLTKRKTYFWLTVVVVGILMWCLFPVWPVEVRLVIWWVSYVLLMFMVGILLIRLVVYAFFYIFGIEFWIFPNILDDKVNLFIFIFKS
jgi:hypothetical protein